MSGFGTVLTCMDGRVQRPVHDYLSDAFGLPHLDTVTAAGMIRHLATDTDRTPVILGDLEISIDRHGSNRVGVVAHHDCAGNPVPDAAQRTEVVTALARLAERYPGIELVGLWVNETWTIECLDAVPGPDQ